MTARAASDLADPVRRLELAGQGHLVEHARGLPSPVRDGFLREVASVPWEEVAAAFGPRPPPPPVLRTPITLTWRRQEREGGLRRRLAGIGERLLSGGRVATVLLAGGQGTRMRHPGPKGTFVLGPEPDRTLFRIHAERVAAVSRRAGRAVPLHVLVSRATEEATREAFERAGDWGLDPSYVRLVRQAELPAVDDARRALLEAPGRLATTPDGHGGAVGALVASGALADLDARGVDVVTFFHVDNPLALPLDPVLLGWMVERKAQAVFKAVRKRDPAEKLGTIGREVTGRHRVVEYSEVPEGGLSEDLVLGSIGVYAFSVRWLARTTAEPGFTMPLHLARKTVPFLDPSGRLVAPDAPNAWKLERFLFDLLPRVERFEVHEVLREREFAPLKNAEGPDSPEEARLLVAAEVRRSWAERGLPAPEPPSLRPLEAADPVEP